MNAHTWLTEQEHRLSMLLSQVFIYVTAPMHINSQLGFLKFQFFNGQNGQAGGTASLCQNWLKSLQPRPRYRDFSNFQDGGRRHVGFLKFQIFNGRKGQECRSASVCQISSKSLELRRSYGDFSIFKMAAAAILDFRNMKFLTFGTVKRVELSNHATFCLNRSNRGRDIVI